MLLEGDGDLTKEETSVNPLAQHPSRPLDLVARWR